MSQRAIPPAKDAPLTAECSSYVLVGVESSVASAPSPVTSGPASAVDRLRDKPGCGGTADIAVVCTSAASSAVSSPACQPGATENSLSVANDASGVGVL
jgi:hypothetical protein